MSHCHYGTVMYLTESCHQIHAWEGGPFYVPFMYLYNTLPMKVQCITVRHRYGVGTLLCLCRLLHRGDIQAFSPFKTHLYHLPEHGKELAPMKTCERTWKSNYELRVALLPFSWHVIMKPDFFTRGSKKNKNNKAKQSLCKRHGEVHGQFLCLLSPWKASVQAYL